MKPNALSGNATEILADLPSATAAALVPGVTVTVSLATTPVLVA